MTLRLESPSNAREAEFLDMAAEFAAHGEPRYTRSAADFAGHLRLLADQSEGRGLAPGHVAQSQFWLGDDGRVLGVSRVRHELTPELEHEGGHIGYDIRPSERGKGMGTLLLQLTLVRARALGLDDVRITCDDDNVGSIRVIEKNGGRLINITQSRTRDALIRQYWVSTG